MEIYRNISVPKGHESSDIQIWNSVYLQKGKLLTHFDSCWSSKHLLIVLDTHFSFGKQMSKFLRKKKKYADRHTFTISGSKFIVDRKYVPVKPIGTGAYGVVCAVVDKTTNKKVAIKKIPNAFDDLVDAKRILREIKLLHHFDHENIIGLCDLVNPLTKQDFEDVYIILDYMETDLHKVIYSKNDLTEDHCQYFVYQILRALKCMHSANVLHRDLKPSNLLVNSNCDLKVCDFGLARGVHGTDNGDEQDELTEYVVTRWYRAPEIMCACQEYDYKIDIWSVGCIFGELLGRKPLFPGDNYIHQLNLIFGAIGTPTEKDLQWVSNEKALQYIKSLEQKPKIPFSDIYPEAPEDAIDLLDMMLRFDPNKRPTVEECLQHPYFSELHCEEDEPICETKFDFGFEANTDTKIGIQQEMFKEIVAFRPEAEEMNPLK